MNRHQAHLERLVQKMAVRYGQTDEVVMELEKALSRYATPTGHAAAKLAQLPAQGHAESATPDPAAGARLH